MKTITSRQDNIIKTVASLQNKEERKKKGLFIAEGIRVVTSLINSGVKLHQIYITQDIPQELLALEKLCTTEGYNVQDIVTLITPPVLDKISATTSPCGIVGVFYIPRPQPLTGLTGGIVLANISSPGNMGTIIRTAAALTTQSVVIVEGTDVWSPKVVQASAGTLGMVNIFECSWKELIDAKKDLQLCALVVENGEKPTNLDPQKTLLVVGNEAHGLPQEWISHCDTTVTLPMPGNTESLNAALAISIVMYLQYLNCKF